MADSDGSGTGPRPGGQPADVGASMRAAQPWVDVAWQFIGAVMLCTLLGWWLDGRLKTTPWLLVTGSVLGMTVGMVSLFRNVARLNALEKQKRIGKSPAGPPDAPAGP